MVKLTVKGRVRSSWGLFVTPMEGGGVLRAMEGTVGV